MFTYTGWPGARRRGDGPLFSTTSPRPCFDIRLADGVRAAVETMTSIRTGQAHVPQCEALKDASEYYLVLTCGKSVASCRGLSAPWTVEAVSLFEGASGVETSASDDTGPEAQ